MASVVLFHLEMHKALVHSLALRQVLSALTRAGLFTFVTLFVFAADAALRPYLLKDINPNTESGLFGTGQNSVVGGWPLSPIINGVAYFRAVDAEHGWELWRSDGSTEGTWLVKDLLPGNIKSRRAQKK